jgi:hypothetical protein
MRRMKTAKCRMSFVRFAGYRGKQAKILSDGSLEDLLPQFCGDVESVKLPEQCAGEGPRLQQFLDTGLTTPIRPGPSLDAHCSPEH